MSRRTFLVPFILIGSFFVCLFSARAELSAPSSQVPQVISKTHPDEGKWYANNNPQFSWILPVDAQGVSYLISNRPTSNPGNVSDGLKDNISFTNVADGIHYFHAKFRRQGTWGPIQHFAFRVDTATPQPFNVTVPENSIGARQYITFETTDTPSGIERYDIRVDGGAPVTVEAAQAGRPYFLSGLLAGMHTVTVTAVDKAGNSTVAQMQVQTEGLNHPVIVRAPHRVTSGGAIVLSGTAPAQSRVVIYFENKEPARAQIIHDRDMARIVTTTTGVQGNWTIQVNNIPDGIYRVQAFTQYSDGSISLSSDPVTVRIGGLVIGGLFDWLADVFLAIARWQERWFTLSIIFYTVLALVVAHSLLPRLAHTGASFWSFRKKVRVARELKSDEQQLMKQLVELHEDIGKELKLLQEIGRHRSLYPDERYLRTKLSQYQKALKTLIPQKRKRSSR